MPLSINVGLSRKASKDYQSTGTSINIIAELDAALLAKPDELQKQIDGLYREAQAAIDRNTVAPEPPPVRDNGRYDRKTYSDRGGNGYGNGSGDRGHSYSNGNRRSNGNGNSNGGGNGRSNSGSSGGGSGGGMTDSQRRAINAISRRVNVDAALEARDIIGTELEELTLRQASDLIDHLKTIEPAGNARNNRS